MRGQGHARSRGSARIRIFQEQFQDGGLGRRRRLHVHDGGDGSARSRATALARRGSARLRIADARPAVRGEATIPQAVGSRARAPRALSLSFHRRETRDTPGIGSRSSTSGSRLSASRRRRAASRVAVARASRPRPSTSSMRLRCARVALTRALSVRARASSHSRRVCDSARSISSAFAASPRARVAACCACERLLRVWLPGSMR